MKTLKSGRHLVGSDEVVVVNDEVFFHGYRCWYNVVQLVYDGDCQVRGSDAFQMVLLVEARGGYLRIKGRRRGVREREDNKEIFLNLIF